MGYVDLKYRPASTDLVCSFYLEPARGFTVRKVAEHVAGESSIGTWTAVKTMSPRIQKLGAKVFSIKGNWIKIAYPQELFEPGNMPQIFSSIAGNIFGMKAVRKLRLEDVEWPKKIMGSFKGPRFGIKGVRRLLKIPERPLVGTIVKPKVGLTSREHARVAYEAWTGGLDLVKMDENLTSLRFNRFEKNVKESLKMRDKAERETGEEKIYVANVTAETKEMLKRARFVEREGGKCVMVDILTAGWSALQTLRDAGLGLVIHAHRAGHAAFTRGKHGISMLVVADASRLIGVDQLHIGALGKMEAGRKEVVALGEEIEKRIIKPRGHILAEDWGKIKPVFAVCSGGLHPGLVPRLVHLLGKDIIAQAGGGVHGNPLGTRAGAAAMRQAVDAALKGIPLGEFARTHRELKAALDKWGCIVPK